MTKEIKIVLGVITVVVVLGGTYIFSEYKSDVGVPINEKEESLFMIETDDSVHVAGFKTALNKTEKGQTYSEWTQEHPSVSCKKYQGSSFVTTATEFWCYQCQENFSQSTALYSFYFEPSKSSCTLQQFQMRWQTTDTSAKKNIEEVASKNLGPGSEAEYKLLEGGLKSWANLHGPGSPFWEDIFTWQNDQDLSYSYVDPGKFSQKPGLRFLWRWQPLLGRMSNYDRDSLDEIFEAQDEERKKLAEKPCKETGISNCSSVVALLGSLQSEKLDKALEDALNQLKKTAKNDPTYPPLLFWISLIKPDCVSNYMRKDIARLEKLKVIGLTFQESPLGECYVTDDPWLEELSGMSETDWGRQAFLQRLRRGWVLGAICPGGPDVYQVVIEQGEKFLRDYPSTEVSLAVILEIARAYETWWSLSQADPDDHYSTRPVNSEEARLKAIEYYKLHATKNALDFDDQERLYRLTNNIDTGQRDYFCIYD